MSRAGKKKPSGARKQKENHRRASKDPAANRKSSGASAAGMANRAESGPSDSDFWAHGSDAEADLGQARRSESEYQLEFQNVRRTYGSGEATVHALRGISFGVRRGEFVSLMGPSGSGKSTTMNILGCLDKATSGTYLFQSVATDSLDRNELALLRRNHIGFVFQGFNLLSRTSALENVELPLIYRGENSQERKDRSLRALQMVGLSGREKHTPAELSGGQQQRVAVARAIVTDPDIILADEPTGNLDTERSHEIMQLLRELNQERNITIILVTHEPDMAAYADRSIHFMDGAIA